MPYFGHQHPPIEIIYDLMGEKDDYIGRGGPRRGQKRRSDADADEEPASQRSRGDGGNFFAVAKFALVSSALTPIYMRISLDYKIEYAMVIRSDGIGIGPVVWGAAKSSC